MFVLKLEFVGLVACVGRVLERSSSASFYEFKIYSSSIPIAFMFF